MMIIIIIYEDVDEQYSFQMFINYKNTSARHMQS